MFGDIPYEEWTDALDATAEDLLWEAGTVEPPVDAFLIAMRLGVLVTEDYTLPARAQFVRLGVELGSVSGQRAGQTEGATIVLGDEERFERRQFAVAHELGEFAAERVFDRLAIGPRHTPLGSREEVANALAGRLLLPRRWFRKHGLEWDWDLLELKSIFSTASHELIARRMLDMRPKLVITLFDQGHITWRRTNFGQSAGPLLQAERDCWRESHELGLATRGESAGSSEGETAIRCWPVHEPDWKREIMRTELPEWE